MNKKIASFLRRFSYILIVTLLLKREAIKEIARRIRYICQNPIMGRVGQIAKTTKFHTAQIIPAGMKEKRTDIRKQMRIIARKARIIISPSFLSGTP